MRDAQIQAVSRILQFGLLISTSLALYYGINILTGVGGNNPNAKTTFLIAEIFAAFHLMGIYWLKKEYYPQIVLASVWGAFAIIMWVMQTLGLGFYSPIFYLVFVLIIMSGYLLGLRHLLLFSTTACLSIIFIYFQEVLGWRVTEYPIPRFDLLMLILFSVLFCTMGTRVTLVELNTRSDELESIQDGLEEMVQKRTIQLADALNKAEKANQAKSTFLATMSHELRTPLNAIIGYTDMLEEDFVEGTINQDSVEDVVRVRKSGQHLLSLINTILDLSKIEAGEEEFYIEPISIQELIDEVVTTARPLCSKSQNRLEVYLHHMQDDSGEAVSVVADRQKLCQILLNLVSNACKFTQGGTVTIAVDLINDAQEIEFSVRDTGIGIPEADIDQLFEPFLQLDNAYNRKYEGTGLGLAITKQYCQAMGGQISAANHADGGAIFKVILPAM
ncbi:MAG: sensor histidine kinase [Anaerolineae bacterium]